MKDRLANAARVQDVRRSMAEALSVPSIRISAADHAVEHHRAHIASSFLVSPFDQAACLSIDGFGDFLSAMSAMGRGTGVTTISQIAFPHSVGLFYTAVTQYLGFPNYGDEYKVMGLAPYGQPEFLHDLRQILRVDRHGYKLDLSYFLHHSEGVAMVWDSGAPELGRVYSDKFVKRFGPARRPEEPLESRHANLAASAQAMVEEAYFSLLNQLHEQTGVRQVCLSGGVAYNSVANGKIRRETAFDEIFIQPAAGDAGTAIGAAFTVWHRESGQPRGCVMRHAAWGPSFDQTAIRQAVQARERDITRARASTFSARNDSDLCDWVAGAIADGRVVGWFQGRMEWGARALGHRSILADPRRREMKDILNQRIKRRESFRPFCPSILEAAVPDYFEGAHPDPFMITVYPVRAEKRDIIPAVTHVDGTGRLQSVSEITDPLYARLLGSFQRHTGVPVLLNTSFNENEPIVRTPSEAL